MNSFTNNHMKKPCNDACSYAPAFSCGKNMSVMDTIPVMVSIFVVSIISLLCLGVIILSVLVIILSLVIFMHENMDGEKQAAAFMGFCSY